MAHLSIARKSKITIEGSVKIAERLSCTYLLQQASASEEEIVEDVTVMFFAILPAADVVGTGEEVRIEVVVSVKHVYLV